MTPTNTTPPSLPLTPRQAEVLRWVFAYWTTHGCPPSIRDVMRGMEISSPNGVVCHLVALEAKGFLTVASKGDRRTRTSTVSLGRPRGAIARAIRLKGVQWTPVFDAGEAGERLRAVVAPPEENAVPPEVGAARLAGYDGDACPACHARTVVSSGDRWACGGCGVSGDRDADGALLVRAVFGGVCGKQGEV